MKDRCTKTPIKGQEFRCPSCQSITTATAVLDWAGHHEGSIPLMVENGEIYIDWDNADLDLELIYQCDECEEEVAHSLEEMEDIIRTYEKSQDEIDDNTL